jgi:hypothetical protein
MKLLRSIHNHATPVYMDIDDDYHAGANVIVNLTGKENLAELPTEESNDSSAGLVASLVIQPPLRVNHIKQSMTGKHNPRP